MLHHNNGNGNGSSRILCQWTTPVRGVRVADSTVSEMQQLIHALPQQLSRYLTDHYGNRLLDLTEIYIQLGQCPECIFTTANNNNTGPSSSSSTTVREFLGTVPCTQADVDMFSSFFEATADNVADNTEVTTTTSKRKGIPHTLHRVSLITHPMRTPEKVLGVTVRVGRALVGLTATMLWPQFLSNLAKTKQSLLLIGKPGVGKTTALREVAQTLSEDRAFNVVVVDKTCELAGDGDTPHSAIGRARWMPVGRPNLQHVIMREAVENQSPDVIIVDEISTADEVRAARTICQRGVALIASVHGTTLPEIMNCTDRSSLTGGCVTVTLSGKEAERRWDKQKQVLKRAREPVFGAALELHERSKWTYHPNVKVAVDSYLEGEPVEAQELHPGKAVAVWAIPDEGCFDYCTACGLGGQPCNEHRVNFTRTSQSTMSSAGSGSSLQAATTKQRKNKGKRSQATKSQRHP